MIKNDIARAMDNKSLIILLHLKTKANIKKSDAIAIEVIRQLLQNINDQVNNHIQLRYK